MERHFVSVLLLIKKYFENINSFIKFRKRFSLTKYKFVFSKDDLKGTCYIYLQFGFVFCKFSKCDV